MLTTVDDRVRVWSTDERSGDWFDATGDRVGELRMAAGVTGNRLDPSKRVTRTRWSISVRGRRAPQPDRQLTDVEVSVTRTWPRPLDVTDRPGEFVADLAGELAAAGAAESQIDAALDAVGGWVRRRIEAVVGHSVEISDAPLDVTLCVLAFPLLGVPCSRTGAAPRSVPRILGPLLRRPDARSAASMLGTRVTRPLVRAVAGSLLPDDERVVFDQLSLAMMAGPTCGPEQLATILETPAVQPGAVEFSRRDLAAAHSLLGARRPRRVLDDLVRALSTEGGTIELARELAQFDPRPVLPPPPPAPEPPRRRRPAPRATPPAQPRAITYPAAWQALAGTLVAGHRVILPRLPDDLLDWGGRMGNCLAAYRAPVGNGTTRILGLDDGRGIQYALEVSATGALRQFETRQNRLPAQPLAKLVVDELRAKGIVRVDARPGVRA